MICKRCNSYFGDPCACCRTLSRIQFLVERSRLPLHTESAVLSLLRQAAGGLADITEQFGFRQLAPLPPPPAPEGAAATAASSSARPGVSTPEVAPAEAVGKKEKSKKDEKKGSTAKTTSVEERRPGVEETPAEAEEDPEVIRAAKATPLKERKTKPENEIQQEVDQFVSDHPGTFGLGSISVRGSAARHLSRNDERRHERPPEPVGPPQGETLPRAERRGTQARERSRSRRKKSKGVQHRERGRAYWRNARKR